MSTDEKNGPREDVRRTDQGDGNGTHHGGAPDGADFDVRDRRRFTAQGEPVAGADGPHDGGAAADAAADPELALEEMIPLAQARMWEQRALEAEARLRDFADSVRKYKAEHDAIRARLERDKDARVREALGRSFTKILEVIDNFERALEFAPQGPLVDGLVLTLRQLLDVLAAEGLERVEMLGHPYDPELAEAVALEPVNDPEEHNRVTAELRPGYRFHGQILRPAQVRVGKLPN
jgi:molecular chaperone GrpE